MAATATVTRHDDDSKPERSTDPARSRRGQPTAYHARVRGPPITLTCDCGAASQVAYGERWTCSSCGTTWNTSQIPREDYDRLTRSVRRYRLLVLGPPVALAAVLIPLSVALGVQYAFLLFLLVLAWGLLVMPQLRSRATARVLRERATWNLHPE